MKLFEFLVLLGAIVSVAWMFRPRRSPRGAHGADGAAQAENARLQEDLKALKERVAVLERIATDRGSLLDQEIERLRDR